MTTKVTGAYYYNDAIIGYVEDFDPKTWFGKVTLLMVGFYEYGTLDQLATVYATDGKKYKKYTCPF